MIRTAAAAAAAALALSGCIPEEGPMMAPGQDCMECHSSGASEEDARPWTVAGTIAGRKGAHVTITDRNGWSFTLRSNQAGNFYTAEPVALPLSAVSVDGSGMTPQDMAATGTKRNPGSCNASGCHPGGVGGGGGGD